MVIIESLQSLIAVFVICYIFIYAPIILIKKCFSLKSLLITILIQSIIGIILNLLLLIKYMKFEFILPQIFYLISIISSIILLHKLKKLKKQKISLTKMKCGITCNSISLSILFFLLIIFLFTFIITVLFSHCRVHSEQYDYFIFYNFIFCYANFISFASLRYIDINNKCCYKANFNNKNIKPISSVSSLQNNTNINITSNAINESKNNIKLSNYYILSDSQEINNSSNGNKKFNIDIIFKISDDKKIKINIPSDITIKMLIDYIFKKMKIDNKNQNIEFILNSEVLNKMSNDKLIEKYNSGDFILIIDENNSIQLNKGITYLKYEEI
jgi:hypothetical protein